MVGKAIGEIVQVKGSEGCAGGGAKVQVTGQVTGHRSQATGQVTGHTLKPIGHWTKAVLD